MIGIINEKGGDIIALESCLWLPTLLGLCKSTAMAVPTCVDTNGCYTSICNSILPFANFRV